MLENHTQLPPDAQHLAETFAPLPPTYPTGVLLVLIPTTAALPDVETNVLLFLSDGTSCEGFLDDDGAGTPVWRDVTACPIEGATVSHWAAMPQRKGAWE